MKNKTMISLVLLITLLFQNKIFSFNASLSFDYSSTYWWRGIELNGKGVGVFWITPNLSLKNFNIYIASGLNQDWFVTSTTESKNNAMALHEFDYGFDYNYDLKITSLTAGLRYIHYPFYTKNGLETDPSFFEAYFISTLKTKLSPTFEFYYNYYIEESLNKTPTNKDFYIKLALSHELISLENFSLTINGWLGYYNNAYLDAKGFSDAVINYAFSYSHNDFTYSARINFGRSLSSDFYISDDLKNHIWADISISKVF